MHLRVRVAVIHPLDVADQVEPTGVVVREVAEGLRGVAVLRGHEAPVVVVLDVLSLDVGLTAKHGLVLAFKELQHRGLHELHLLRGVQLVELLREVHAQPLHLGVNEVVVLRFQQALLGLLGDIAALQAIPCGGLREVRHPEARPHRALGEGLVLHHNNSHRFLPFPLPEVVVIPEDHLLPLPAKLTLRQPADVRCGAWGAVPVHPARRGDSVLDFLPALIILLLVEPALFLAQAEVLQLRLDLLLHAPGLAAVDLEGVHQVALLRAERDDVAVVQRHGDVRRDGGVVDDHPVGAVVVDDHPSPRGALDGGVLPGDHRLELLRLDRDVGVVHVLHPSQPHAAPHGDAPLDLRVCIVLVHQNELRVLLLSHGVR
eukprot:RCo041772